MRTQTGFVGKMNASKLQQEAVPLRPISGRFRTSRHARRRPPSAQNIRYEISEMRAVLFGRNSSTLTDDVRVHRHSDARPARAARRFAMQGRSADGWHL
jgi:hypothetical protein